RAVLDKIPYLALSLLFGIVALGAQKGSGALEGEGGRPPLDRAVVAGHALVVYLGKTIWPRTLSAYVPYPSAPGVALPRSFAWAALAVVPLGLLVVGSLRRTREVAFAALFFVATTVLVLQIVPVGGAMLADRYTYLPGVALAYLAAAGV